MADKITDGPLFETILQSDAALKLVRAWGYWAAQHPEGYPVHIKYEKLTQGSPAGRLIQYVTDPLFRSIMLCKYDGFIIPNDGGHGEANLKSIPKTLVKIAKLKNELLAGKHQDVLNVIIRPYATNNATTLAVFRTELSKIDNLETVRSDVVRIHFVAILDFFISFVEEGGGTEGKKGDNAMAVELINHRSVYH